jgi:hypothetical protein
MRQFKVLVIAPEDGALGKCDGVEYEGKLWFVPQWLDVPAQGVKKPARLLRFDTLPHQAKPNSPYQVDYVINYPIPHELFEIRTPTTPMRGFEWEEMPNLTFPLGDKMLN